MIKPLGGLIEMYTKIFIFSITFFIFCSIITISDDIKNDALHEKGDILYVGGTGPGNYSTIQSAVENATDGDTVYVYSGSYQTQITLEKSLNLIGEDRNNTFIGKVIIQANNSLVKNFSIINNQKDRRAGGSWTNCISVFSSNNTVANNIIFGVETGILVGLEYNEICNNTIRNCFSGIVIGSAFPICKNNQIHHNIFIDNEVGVDLYTSNNIISNNSFSNCGLIIWHPWMHSIFHAEIKDNTVNEKPLLYLERQSDITFSTPIGQIIGIDSHNITIKNQEINNASTGILMWNCSYCKILNSTTTNNSYFYGGGVFLFNSSNITLKNTSIKENLYGIVQDGTIGNTIDHCEIGNNEIAGLILASSKKATLKNNQFTDNGISILPGFISNWDIFYPEEFDTHIIINNSINGKPIACYKNLENVSIPHNISQLILINCSQCTINNSDLSRCDIGIQLFLSKKTVISNSTISNNLIGLTLMDSNNNSINSCIIKNNSVHGIESYFSSDLNKITKNDFSNNYLGIFIRDSNNNSIYLNNFIDNNINARDNSKNNWNLTCSSMGNYWDDYSGTDADHDGIGDTAYEISSGSNQDYYPLFYPISDPPVYVWVDDDYTHSDFGWNQTHFNNIQQGIDAVDDDGVVYIYNGYYHENLEIEKPVCLIGEQKNSTIISANYLGSVINISTDWVTVSNLTLKNTGNYSEMGIYADSGVFFQFTSHNRRHCTISNNIFIDCLVGVKSFGADNLTINNNSIFLQNYNSGNGIKIEDTSYCDISHNTIKNCNRGIYIGYQSKHNVISHNIVKNNTGHGINIYSGSQQNSWNKIENNTVMNNGEYGIYLETSGNNKICNNHVENNIWGIALRYNSQKNLISKNTVVNHSRGIYLLSAPFYNTISKNNVSENSYGIWLYSSNYNTILQNNLTMNIDPIKMSSNCNYNIVIGNHIYDNAFTISFQTSNNNNLIYHNNFINNTNPAYDDGVNQWDNGYPIGGNYWSDYTGIDSNNDGIGDDSYNITGGVNQDLYPLMNSFGIISKLSAGWNFLSLPVNFSNNKENVMIYYNDSFFTFNDAVNEGVISPYLFGWNRTSQSYEFANVFIPGQGCWIYSYEPCEIWFQYDSTIDGSYITELKTNWNIISIPYSQHLEKTDLLVDDVSWYTAVSNGWISDYVFGWNSVGQSYEFSNLFEPGAAYWLYSYLECHLKGS